MDKTILIDAKAAGLTISASGDILMEYYGDWIVITDALTKFSQLQAARQSNQRNEAVSDCARYQRLRILGCAPYGSKELEKGTVLRFQTLDSYLDKDIGLHPSRGEYASKSPQTDAVKEALEEARLVSYAPDGSTCTLNINGEEIYYDRTQTTQPESEGK